jgi:hypothetical protein
MLLSIDDMADINECIELLTKVEARLHSIGDRKQHPRIMAFATNLTALKRDIEDFHDKNTPVDQA